MADMEALKEQLMNMKRNGKGFLCVGTDDPEEAAEIMKIAAELAQEDAQEKEEKYDPYEDDCGGEYVYTCNGEVYDDAGIAELVAENFERLAIDDYENSLRDFLRDLETEETDCLKDGVLKTLDTMKDGCEVLGIRKKTVKRRSN